ncbi:hypothetical protein CR513_56210, partial [Mucuna pruriens]
MDVVVEDIGQQQEEINALKGQMGKILEVLQNLEVRMSKISATQATPDHPPGYTPRPNPGPYPYRMPYMGEEEIPYNPQRDAHVEGVNHPRNNTGLPQEQELVVEEIPVRNTTSIDTPINARVSREMTISRRAVVAIEGANKYRFEVVDLGLIPDIVILHKFKVLDFDKYKESSCPKNHLISYCRKMAVHTQDDKKPHGVAYSWYLNLEKGQIRTWGDLAKDFLKQYRYNEELAPDRTQLQRMTKRDTEIFKEYA